MDGIGLTVLEGVLAHSACIDEALVVPGGPAGRVGLRKDIEFARQESAERDVFIAIVVDANLVEIIHAAIDRQVFAPIVGVALKHEIASRFECADAIGPARIGRLKQCGLDAALFPERFAENRQFADQ